MVNIKIIALMNKGKINKIRAVRILLNRNKLYNRNYKTTKQKISCKLLLSIFFHLFEKSVFFFCIVFANRMKFTSVQGC